MRALLPPSPGPARRLAGRLPFYKKQVAELLVNYGVGGQCRETPRRDLCNTSCPEIHCRQNPDVDHPQLCRAPASPPHQTQLGPSHRVATGTA